MATKTRKRKATAKQLANLRKGRLALKRKRSASKKRRTVSAVKRKKPRKTARRRSTPARKSNPNKPVIVINQGDTTMKRKRRVRRKATTYRRKRRSRYLSGGLRIPKMSSIQNMVVETAVGTASAIGGTMLTAKLPVTNTKVKAFIPLAAGILLQQFAKGRNARHIANAALGMRIAGGLALVKQFAPQFALAGEDEMYAQQAVSDRSLLGINTDLMGVNSDLVSRGDEDFALEEEDVY